MLFTHFIGVCVSVSVCVCQLAQLRFLRNATILVEGTLNWLVWSVLTVTGCNEYLVLPDDRMNRIVGGIYIFHCMTAHKSNQSDYLIPYFRKFITVSLVCFIL